MFEIENETKLISKLTKRGAVLRESILFIKVLPLSLNYLKFYL